MDEKLLEKFGAVKLLVLDVDGVMTDGRITYDSTGKEIKSFHVRDGFGMKLLKKAGVECAIISARTSAAVRRRVWDVGVEHLYQGTLEKAEAFKELLEKTGVKPEETAFMGDDIVDMPAMKKAGIAVTVADAVEAVRKSADYVTLAEGGKGAVREVAEIILKASGKWDEVAGRFLKR